MKKAPSLEITTSHTQCFSRLPMVIVSPSQRPLELGNGVQTKYVLLNVSKPCGGSFLYVGSNHPAIVSIPPNSKITFFEVSSTIYVVRLKNVISKDIAGILLSSCFIKYFDSSFTCLTLEFCKIRL